ncbi:lipocalin family protein [Marinicella litoralis]|nr:lipocalin family protein [Marinicella litoralis]
MKNLLIICGFIVLNACTGYPENIKPVENFQLDNYLGTWYEVARLDHSFERGLQQVSATYSMREDGGIKVINRGFNTDEEAWSEATGKAYFVQDEKTAHLKVSFFGPFYGSYVIFYLDPDYQTAFVVGNDLSYLWLLSRTPTVNVAIKNQFLQLAAEKGFAVDELIWVSH